MDRYVVHGNVGMTRGSTVRIEDGRGMLVYVWEGALWLTQEKDPVDRHIGAGEWFLLDRQGVAVIHALERSVVTLTAPEPALYARRVTLSIAGTGTRRVLYDAAQGRGSLIERLRQGLRQRWIGVFRPRARATSAAL